MRQITIIYIVLFFSYTATAQHTVQLSPTVFLGVSTNIETYFFVEKLAVEKIGNFVFDIKGTDYSHQPIVFFGYKHFQQYQNDPLIIRAANILKQLRDSLHDNGPIMEYLLNQKEFPATGARFTGINSDLLNNRAPAKSKSLLAELTDSLRKFYIHRNVAGFLDSNASFYRGAINEVAKDVNKSAFSFMEKWYGKKFPQYELYISPAMPITPGEDSYRGFGPQILSSKGIIRSMMISSSTMLQIQDGLSKYKQFGFDNPAVTRFIFYHETMHSFVNPLLEKYSAQIKADSLLFTKSLKDILSPHYISDWTVCLTEHLVRLGEIRIAVSMNNNVEADRLRKLHITEYKCVLIPILEQKIKEYETDRASYTNFESYLPKLISFFHTLSTKVIDEQVAKYGK